MAKVENSAAPASSFAEATLPKLGAFATLGVTLMMPACASTRPSPAFTQPVVPIRTAEQVVEDQAIRRGRDEFSHAQNVARHLGISNFVYVASNGRDFTAFSKADSIEGNIHELRKSAIVLREHGHRIEFNLEAFQTWKDRQITSVHQQRLSGVIIDLDGRVLSLSHPTRPVARVEPFLVLRDQK